ncbi:hypothetical protein EH223_01405 [candidate division KSB1 bacterium]|nr:hypothetical protein [candidate division KSB1 bacterium]RQW06858.1 MAG: hypothetical protein EH223_01405 [candidate division KSB1 bacterium]
MICNNVQKKLILQEELRKRQAEHFARCPDCQKCAADVEQLTLPAALSPPAQTKMDTLELCLRKLGRSDLNSTGTHRIHFWHSPRMAFVLGVLAIFLLAATVILQLYVDGSEKICRIIALFLLMVFVQNLLTALCAPIILQKKAVITHNI